jgi:F-type H+-transporting ATPase subunit delta
MPLTEAAPDALARTYAQSLFELAKVGGGQSAIESTLAELEDILELARTDARFSEFLASRILPAEKRAASLERIFKGRASDLVVRFLLTLNEKGRLGHLAPIVAAFDHMVQAAFGRIEVDVYTASPISSGELDVIRDRLKRALGKEPIVHPYTDDTMIGGLKLQIGDQLIDASVATSLRKLRDRLASDGSARVRAAAERIINSGDYSGNGRMV